MFKLLKILFIAALIIVVVSKLYYWLSLAFVLFLYRNTEQPPTLPGKPETIEEMLPLLKSFSPRATRDNFIALPEMFATRHLAFHYRRDIIADWRLTDPGSAIAGQFKRAGVTNYDDMGAATGILYHRYLTNKPLRKEQLLRDFAEGTLKWVESEDRVVSTRPEDQYNFQEILNKYYYSGRQVWFSTEAYENNKEFYENRKYAEVTAEIIRHDPNGRLYVKVLHIEPLPGFYTPLKVGDTEDRYYEVVNLRPD